MVVQRRERELASQLICCVLVSRRSKTRPEEAKFTIMLSMGGVVVWQCLSSGRDPERELKEDVRAGEEQAGKGKRRGG